MIARACSVAVVVLAMSCMPGPRVDPAKEPPAPEVTCDSCVPLHPLRPNNVLRVDARWSSKCTKWYPEEQSDTHSEDERSWVPVPIPCQRQPFRATASCDRACDITAWREEPVSSKDAGFTIWPHGSGPIRISVDLYRDDTRETFHWTSDAVFAFAPEDITVLCFDPAGGGYDPCATQPLDPDQPYFALAVRTGPTWAPLRAGLVGRRSAEDVRREMIEHGEPGAHQEGELEPYSLRAVLGVDPPPAGDYHVTFEVESMTIERTVRVSASRR